MLYAGESLGLFALPRGGGHQSSGRHGGSRLDSMQQRPAAPWDFQLRGWYAWEHSGFIVLMENRLFDWAESFKQRPVSANRAPGAKVTFAGLLGRRGHAAIPLRCYL